MSDSATFKVNSRFIRAVLESLGSPLVVCDGTGRVVYTNKIAKKILIQPDENLVGNSLANYLGMNKKQLRELLMTWEGSLKSGQSWTGNFSVLNEEKKAINITATVSICSCEHESIFIFMFSENMSNRQIEEEMQRSQLGAMKYARMAAIGQMTAGITHEINNPLSVIAGNAHLIRAMSDKSALSPSLVNTYVDKIEKSITRIQNVIKGMKTFVRKGDHLPKEIQSIQTIIDDTLALCRDKYKQNGIELTISLPEDPIYIHCNHAQISQILINLLNNSFDALQALSERWLKIEAYTEGELVNLSITDSGDRIPDSLAKKIFRPFSTSKPIGSGMGLGLSLSKSFAQDHNGNIELDQHCPNTRFIVSLPFVQPLKKTA